MVGQKRMTPGKVLVVAALAVITAVTIYPILYILSMSFSGAKHLLMQDVWLFPKDITLDSYRVLFRTNEIWRAYWNTVKYTLLGTIISLVTTVALSYSVSQKNFAGRRAVIWTIMFTMFFSGGLIPAYILVNQLGLINTTWAIVLPGAVNAWNMIITRTYFVSLPSSLFESASLDGAGEFRKLFYLGIPLAKPIIAVLSLYMIVGFWNTYFSAVIYLDSSSMHPIQNYLQKILYDSSFTGSGITGGAGASLQIEQLKYSAIVITMFPIMMVYPFIQKYFVKGIMLGSIKE